MSKLSDKKRKTFNTVSSVQTLLERYPTLTTTDPMLSNFSVNTSLGFLLDLLRIFGVDYNKLIIWVSKLLVDNSDKGNGLLDAIEQAIKAILMANIKELFTCSINPILPDNIMKYVYDSNNNGAKPDPSAEGISINLNMVDLFGMLKTCPTSEDGGIFYFDAYESILGENYTGYNPNNVWQSMDFNAFLWYVINKGNIDNLTNKQINTWDNRTKYIKTFKEDSELKDEFFKIDTGTSRCDKTNIQIGDSDNSIIKQQIIICEYVERNTNSTYNTNSDVLKVWLNANRYFNTKNIGNISINKTIFEFNYDYIYSLKLFDSKTLISQILNSMFGLSASLSVSYSIQQKLIEGKINQIIKKVIEEDDTQITDCYYSFSNDEYDKLLNEATAQHNGSYQYNGKIMNIDKQAVIDALNGINNNVTLNEKVQNLSKILTDIASSAATNSVVEESDKFTFGYNFIYDFINQTVMQIVTQVLSPKVAILYQINNTIMGTPVDDFKSWEYFIENNQNLIVTITRQIKDIIVKELYNFVMEQLQPLIKLFISKLALETIKYYKDIINDLIVNCIPNLQWNGNGGQSIIDNVNYADIIPTKEEPNNKC